MRDLRGPDLRLGDEQRTFTIVGLTLLSLALVFAAAILFAIVRSVAVSGVTAPTPATILLLLAGFGLFRLSRRRI